MKLIIADYNGWEKTIALDKAVVRVGSAQTSDIHLDSPQISPTHLQFHYLPESFGCKLMNFGSDVKVLRGEYQEALVSYASTELSNGDEILLGDYRIRVQLPIVTKTIQTSRVISATLLFPNTTLYQHSPSVGWLTVTNIGDQSPCQFHVSVSGFPADCVKIDPIPLLYSGAQEEVRVQLFHRGLYPSAGFAELTIRVFAPSDYPGEQVLIEQGIYVVPVFEQSLMIGDDLHLDDGPAAPVVSKPDLSLVAQSAVSSVPPVAPPPSARQDDIPLSAPIEAVAPPVKMVEEEIRPPATLNKVVEASPSPKEEKVAVEEKPMPKPVIVRDLPEEFWDEE